jgi:predicted phosphodiesterase
MREKINNILLMVIMVVIPVGLAFSAITKGPYLANPQENSMTIMWENDNGELAALVYWQKEDSKVVKKVNFFDSIDNQYLYRVTINCLEADQKYFYKVITKNDSSESYFITNPQKGTPFTFVAIGDSRSNHDVFSAIANDVNKISPRLVINMGDLIAHGNKLKEWNPHFFDPAKQVINHIPHISTLGDHETSGGGYNGYNFYYYFRNGDSVDKMWFSYDYGDVHFISLDYRGDDSEEMIKWFKNDVKQSNAKWKIVYLHRPMYNLGGHRSHWGSMLWQNLYRELKIDIVFAGHSHVYERFYPMRPSYEKDSWPVTFITTGGAGAGLYEAVQNECAAVSKSVNHYNIISVSDNSLKFKSLELDGTVLDQFEIVKKNGVYSQEYLSLVKPQELMDIYMAFASELRMYFNSIPTKETPTDTVITIKGGDVVVDVPFELQLSEESAKYYRIEPFKGTLKKGEKYIGKVVLYAKESSKQNKKYFDPPLYFNLMFKYKGKEYKAYGAQSRNVIPYK